MLREGSDSKCVLTMSIYLSMCPSLTLFELQQHSVVTGVAAEVASALVIQEQLVLPEL